MAVPCCPHSYPCLLYTSYPGWLAYKAPSYVLVEMFVIGVAAYSIIGALQYKKIRKIPMDEALKNVE